MSRRHSVIATAATLALLFLLYLASWHLFFREQLPPTGFHQQLNPFSPPKKLSGIRQLSDSFAYWLYSPMRKFVWAGERRTIQAEAIPSSVGDWKALVEVGGELVPVKLSIDESSIVFYEAARWPELDGRTFSHKVREGPGILSINTDLGEAHIQTPAALMFDGGSPDVMIFRTFRFGGWLERDLQFNRIKN